jgi:hypothetical protein
VCSLYTAKIDQASIGVCALSVAGDINASELKRERYLMGTSAVMFVVSCNNTSSAKVA